MGLAMKHHCKFCGQFVKKNECLEHSPLWEGPGWKKYGWCSHGSLDWEDKPCPQEAILQFTIDLFDEEV
jgi:hypothetical protein